MSRNMKFVLVLSICGALLAVFMIFIVTAPEETLRFGDIPVTTLDKINGDTGILVDDPAFIHVTNTLEMRELIKKTISYKIYLENKPIDGISPLLIQSFTEPYTFQKGILTFRGSPMRDWGAIGKLKSQKFSLSVDWANKTGQSPVWGGGGGWTGQPLLVQWTQAQKSNMHIPAKFKDNPEFTEVIFASLDGRIYFYDFDTGEKTRPPINVDNPIKGTPSIDPRGLPLLYVGEGVPEQGKQKYRIYSLLDQKLLYSISGGDPQAYRVWGGFDSSGIVNSKSDILITGGENGILYIAKLNTEYDIAKGMLSISPKLYKYVYHYKSGAGKKKVYGIENSVAVYKNLLYFSDNCGTIQCVDLINLKPLWIKDVKDDTDASIVVEAEMGVPYLYTGCEVDIQGSKGYSYVRKINGLTGDTVWETRYACRSLPERNGGVFATPMIGKQSLSNMVVFTLAYYQTVDRGLMVALDKTTGGELWRWEMTNYSWSSPTGVYDGDGNGYIVQCDSAGNVNMLDGDSGSILTKLKLPNNIQSTPVFYKDSILIAERGNKLYKISVQ
ncbi:MAG: PQQ-binding-like beta-propeller repeat protein [Brevinematales bacterium]|nr:PQQ-binding-like beta-propeller repeat protein [Brevinematales bacterium]